LKHFHAPPPFDAKQVAPPHAGIELGVGESIIVRALCDATGRSAAQIKAAYKEGGDLGILAEVRPLNMTLFERINPFFQRITPTHHSLFPLIGALFFFFFFRSLALSRSFFFFFFFFFFLLALAFMNDLCVMWTGLSHYAADDVCVKAVDN
jgi:hypothetical protein